MALHSPPAVKVAVSRSMLEFEVAVAVVIVDFLISIIDVRSRDTLGDGLLQEPILDRMES